ncbi:MAG TPA: hypothetical protein VFK50_07085 [Sphingomicrobium sp.]|nr:hypothetical protein [Sphingomicrobium sp.]
MFRPIVLLALLLAMPAAARIVQARGQWAAIAEQGRCRAMARSLRDAAKGQRQAYAAFLFDPARRQAGVLSVRLSRPARPGGSVILTVGDRPFMLKGVGDFAWSRGPAQEAAIIAAVRRSSSMRVEARDGAGRRSVDRYLLDGAPTAIDAAAADCSRR